MSNLCKTSQYILRGFLFLSVSLLFLSCATSPYSDPARLEAESFATVEAVFPHWQPFEQGISLFHGKVVTPKIDFWALRIELAAPDLKIIAMGGAENAADGTGRTLSTRVSSFVKANRLTAGINAVPFDIVSYKEGRPINNIGIVISDGKPASPAYPSFDALVFYTDGETAVVSQSAILSTENIANAVGGFFQVLLNGEPAEKTLGLEIRHPRSAAGISADGKFLYLLVIDGRRPGSVGGTEKEIALLLLALGSWNGINFDGGGSSALVLRRADGKIRVLNTPIHGRIPGLERAVAGCLGIAVN